MLRWSSWSRWSQLIPTNPYESLWIPMNSNNSKWIHIDSNESQWIPIDSNWSQWIPMDPNEIQWVLIETLWISMDSNLSQWIPIIPMNPNGSKFGIKTCLIWVKKERWMVYFDGCQGCSEGKAQGKFQGEALPARGKARPCQLFCSDLHSKSNSFFFSSFHNSKQCKTDFFNGLLRPLLMQNVNCVATFIFVKFLWRNLVVFVKDLCK